METEPVIATENAAVAAAKSTGVVEKRLALERYSHDNPFVLTPHRPNYLLPAVYAPSRNNATLEDSERGRQRTEVHLHGPLEEMLLQQPNPGLLGRKVAIEAQ
jgi:hypothetical protein